MTEKNEDQASEMSKKLSPEEVETLTKLHRQAQEMVQSIGQMEVRKQALLTSISNIQDQAQGIMNAAASRLGIPPNTAWQMSPDGTVVVLPPKGAIPTAEAPRTH